MKRKILFVLAVLLVIAGLFLLTNAIFSFKHIEKGALQVTANIKSKVYLNGNYIGETQLCKCDQNDTITSGDYEIRIVPENSTLPPFTTRVNINGGVLTVVDRTFLPNSLASSYSLTLQKTTSTKSDLIINTTPESALVTIDSDQKGITPYQNSNLSASEHELELDKPGFSKKTIRIKTIPGYKLIVDASLGTEGADESNTPDATITPTPSTSTTPTPSTTQTVTILDTPNGFLRVRSGAGTTFSEVSRVKPGQNFTLVDEQNGWYEIQVDSNTTGWISSQYAKKE